MRKKHTKFKFLNARISATVSVTMVLLLLGLVALTALSASHITRQIKENLGFDIIFAEDVPASKIDSLGSQLKTMNFVKEVSLFSADDAMKQWKEETGEDVMDVLGVNPFASEYEVKVIAEYASTDSIEIVTSRFRKLDIVEDINIRADMVDSVNKTMNTLILALSIIAIVLFLISFVLINNTIRLSVYARRFTIHTMKLVGATAGFIRKPFVMSNVVSGFIAGIIADILLAVLLFYATSFDPILENVIPDQWLLIVYLSVPVAGVIICAVTSIWATNRYLKYEYDDLFS
ncbi:MAG: permease-like cell division protein FtsX [Muribaculaceae bacterium]|nr:permease-like cell division protein FtsX [Muribaculaceae bacterium]